MEKAIDPITMYLNIHSILKVKACYLIDEVVPKFMEQFGTFTNKENISNDQFDIVVSKLESRMINDLMLETYKPYEWEHFGKNIYNLWLYKFKKNLYAIIFHKGKVDVVINLSEPLKLYYTVRHKCWRNLFNSLILCLHIALYKKNGILFHGAVMCKNDLSIILTGPAGVGKSIFVLNMLNDGWDYLSDDMFILHNYKAHLLRTYSPIRGYHCQLLPWLQKKQFFDKKVIKWINTRGWLKNIAESYLPELILPRLERFLTPSFLLSPTTIFQKSKIINRSKPNILIVLSPGFQFGFAPSSKGEVISDINTIQAFDFPEFEKLGRLISLYNYGDKYDIRKLIDCNLRNDMKYFKMTVPHKPDTNLLYKSFNECLQKVL